MQSTQPTPEPLSYERGAEPLPGVERSGKYLLVRRNCDLSRFCLVCGRPATGQPIRKCLFDGSSFHGTSSTGGSGGGAILAILQLLLLIFYLILVVGEFVSSRSRIVFFGLCNEHGAKRRSFRLIAWLLFLVGAIALLIGIRRSISHHGANSSSGMTLKILCYVAGPVLWIIASIVAVLAPAVSLFKEEHGYLWLKRAGEAFLAAQKEGAPETPKKPRNQKK